VKVIFLSTGRGLSPAFINELRAKLGMHDSDVVCLISWHPARKPLPVSRHLVLGPNIRVAGALATVQRVQRQSYPIAADVSAVDVTALDVTAVDVSAVDVTADADDLSSAIPTPPLDLIDPAAPDAADAIDEADAESDAAAAPAVADATDPAGALAPAHSGATMLPVYDPRRMRKAVAWRIRRAKKAAATHASPRLTGIRKHPLFRKVRNRLSPGVSLSFAASCLRSGQVHDMARPRREKDRCPIRTRSRSAASARPARARRIASLATPTSWLPWTRPRTVAPGPWPRRLPARTWSSASPPPSESSRNTRPRPQAKQPTTTNLGTLLALDPQPSNRACLSPTNLTTMHQFPCQT